MKLLQTMQNTTRIAIALSLLGSGIVHAQESTDAPLTPTEAQKIAVDAYIYGYSLITTNVTKIQMSNVAQQDALHAPPGQFVNVKRYPPADYRGVSAPNADTLYSVAWVDLTEPMVFSHPDFGNRFYLFEMTNLWMIDFNTPGTRTAGGAAANYLLTGPDWQGEVPAGLKHIPVETRYMVILGRIYADGTDEDYKKVNELQSQLKLTPLSAWGKSFSYKAPPVDSNPGISMTDKPQEVINKMDTATYFNMMASLMCKDAPAVKEDQPLLSRMAKIGLEPCKPFDMKKLAPEVQAAMKDIGAIGNKQIEANQKNMGRIENGWSVATGLGVYGTDYLKRATVAAFGWPANLEKDAVYPYTFVDGQGDKLSGNNKYTLTFSKGNTPPVNGFWSITMYQIDNGWWFVPNKLNKFTVSARNNLKYNPDGSVTLYIQTDSPGADKESNWLPAPKNDFLLMMRMYWPKETTPSILNESWKVPPVVKMAE